MVGVGKAGRPGEIKAWKMGKGRQSKVKEGKCGDRQAVGGPSVLKWLN